MDWQCTARIKCSNAMLSNCSEVFEFIPSYCSGHLLQQKHPASKCIGYVSLLLGMWWTAWRVSDAGYLLALCPQFLFVEWCWHYRCCKLLSFSTKCSCCFLSSHRHTAGQHKKLWHWPEQPIPDTAAHSSKRFTWLKKITNVPCI